jgi:hypothetical protein
MLSNLIGLALCVFLLVLWFGIRRENRLAAQRTCRHDWRLTSLYDEGQLWNRRCELCGKQEPVGGAEQLTPERASRRPQQTR